MTTASAIISAYYAEEYLAGRIENLLGQTLIPQIVVVCQERSREFEIACGYEKNNHHGCILVTTTPSIPTVYDAWNIGIRVSTGGYLTNANSDDRHDQDAIRMLVKTLDKYPEYCVAYPDVDRVEKIGGPAVGRFVWKEGGLKELLGGCFIGPMPMWRSALHKRYGYFDGEFSSAGDYEFWLRLAAGGEKFRHVNRTLGQHLEHPGALEHRSPVRSTWETARARALYKGVK